MSTPITFAVRGNSLNALFSTSGSVGAPFATTALRVPVIGNTAHGGLIGGSYIDMYAGANSAKALIWPGNANLPSTIAQSILMRVAFQGGGEQGLFSIGSFVGNGTSPSTIAAYFNSGDLYLLVTDEFGTTVSAGLDLGTLGESSGTYYDIVITMTGDTTADGCSLYVNAVLIGQVTFSGALQSPRNLNLISQISLGMYSGSVPNTEYHLNEFVIWSGIIDPTNVALVGGNGSLNGAARTAFVAANAFDGTINSDPGFANVSIGVDYEIAGVPYVGTLYPVTNETSEAILIADQVTATNPNAIAFTQGDNVIINLVAQDGNGNPVNISGATFSTSINGPLGVPVVFDNGQHTVVNGANGQFTLTLAAADTANCALGTGKEIVTQVTLSSNVTYFHGVGILTVLPNTPIQ